MAMAKEKRTFVLSLVALFCSIVVVLVSAFSMEGSFSRAQMLAVIAGSFGAGASIANAIRDYGAKRKK